MRATDDYKQTAFNIKSKSLVGKHPLKTNVTNVYPAGDYWVISTWCLTGCATWVHSCYSAHILQ